MLGLLNSYFPILPARFILFVDWKTIGRLPAKAIPVRFSRAYTLAGNVAVGSGACLNDYPMLRCALDCVGAREDDKAVLLIGGFDDSRRWWAMSRQAFIRAVCRGSCTAFLLPIYVWLFSFALISLSVSIKAQVPPSSQNGVGAANRRTHHTHSRQYRARCKTRGAG